MLIQHTWTIRNVKAKTRAKARMLAINRGFTLGKFLEDLIDMAWLQDKTKPTHKTWKKVDRVIDKYRHVSDEIIR